MKKPHELLSKTAIVLCNNHGGLIIGSFTKFLRGEIDNPKDIDIIIPLSEWQIASNYIPKGAIANSFGGFKFVEDGVTYDVWCADVQDFILNNNIVAYSLKYNKFIGEL